MDLGHMTVVLKWCMCMLVLDLGIGMIIIITIIITIIIIFFLLFWSSLNVYVVEMDVLWKRCGVLYRMYKRGLVQSNPRCSYQE